MGHAVRAAGRRLAHRAATMADARLLWRWANDGETRRNSFTRSRIGYPEHLAWLERQLASRATRLWIFTAADTPVGQVRCEVGEDRADLHVAVSPAHRGRGYGRAMVQRAVGLLREAEGERLRVRAAVLGHNTRSLRLFRACGFRTVEVRAPAGGALVFVFERGAADPSSNGGDPGQGGRRGQD